MGLLTGTALFDSIRSTRAASAFWWLGQHTFIVKIDDTIVLIDPFLTELEDRSLPPLFEPSEAAGVVDVVACTHDHLDHIDPVAISGLAEHTDAHFVAPSAHEERMRSLGVPPNRLDVLNDGETASVAGLQFHAIKSAHEFFEQTADGHFPFLGYVIQGGGKSVYHSGDTVWWEGLQTQLSRFSLDVVFVPINGRDAKRYRNDIQGNMTYQEAADLVGGLDVKLAVPAHYDMFEWNAEDPNLFVDYMAAKYPGRRVWAGLHTEEVTF